MLQRALFRRRRGQQVITLATLPACYRALLKNAQTLAQLFFHFQHHAGIAVGNAAAHRHFKVKVFRSQSMDAIYVRRGRSPVAACAGGAPLQRLFRAVAATPCERPFRMVLRGGFLVSPGASASTPKGNSRGRRSPTARQVVLTPPIRVSGGACRAVMASRGS